MKSLSEIYDTTQKGLRSFIYRSTKNEKGLLRLIDEISREKCRAYQKNYSVDNSTLQLDKKRVVVIADGVKVGLSDRLKGVAALYSCVQELNDGGEDIDFSVRFSHPFQLADYLEPNKYNWKITADEISYNSSQIEIIWMCTGGLNKYGLNIPLTLKYLRQRIKESKCQQIHVYSNLNPYEFESGSFVKPFDELFKLSKRLYDILHPHYQLLTHGGGYISTSFRFLDLIGDFNEGNGTTLSDDGKNELMSRCGEQLEILHHLHPDKMIFVASDSVTFLNYATSKYPYVYTIDGDITHIANTKDSSFELHQKTFVDMLTIANAEKIYLLRTGKMYNSGFPRTAAEIYNREFEYIEF